jgi:hypothetical protein
MDQARRQVAAGKGMKYFMHSASGMNRQMSPRKQVFIVEGVVQANTKLLVQKLVDYC